MAATKRFIKSSADLQNKNSNICRFDVSFDLLNALFETSEFLSHINDSKVVVAFDAVKYLYVKKAPNWPRFSNL